MFRVLVAIADGSEELESVTVIDVLRRAGALVTVASTMSSTQITASRGVMIQADCLVESVCAEYWDLIVLPGGMPGASHLANHKALRDRIAKQLEAGQWLAAICAAPAVVLGRNGLISDYRATCFPAFQQELTSQAKEIACQAVVVDRNLVTSQGPGTAMEFSLKLVEVLFGQQKRNEIAEQLLYQ